MAKPNNAYLAKRQAMMDHNMGLQRLFTTQQMEDFAIIALGRAFHFGPKRAQEFRELLRQVNREFCEICLDDAKGDKHLVYTKDRVDRELQAILGDGFVPWEERYPDALYK